MAPARGRVGRKGRLGRKRRVGRKGRVGRTPSVTCLPGQCVGGGRADTAACPSHVWAFRAGCRLAGAPNATLLFLIVEVKHSTRKVF